MGMESPNEGEKTAEQYLEEREIIKDNFRSKLREIETAVTDTTLSDEERKEKIERLDTERQNVFQAWQAIENEMLEKGIFDILANRRS
jgi:predicted DNA-binding ArsR family transcriptional regulator